jgi:hypothetical protein
VNELYVLAKASSIANAEVCCVLLSRINEEFRDVKLADLRILATLGVGGFGRVELVQIAGDPTRSFALKQMKKSQVWSRKVITALVVRNREVPHLLVCLRFMGSRRL